MSGRNHSIRKQIEDHVSERTSPIEARIADALMVNGEFYGNLSSDDLKPIFQHVLYCLINEQKIGGVDIPLTHNVNQMKIDIHDQEAHVFCELHIHYPITAFIKFNYVLENDPRSSGTGLRLKNNDVMVTEITKRFDLGAKAALKMVGVKSIAQRELKNPGDIIKKTLPAQLADHDFSGALSHIELQFTPQDNLRVYMTANNVHRSNGHR